MDTQPFPPSEPYYSSPSSPNPPPRRSRIALPWLIGGGVLAALLIVAVVSVLAFTVGRQFIVQHPDGYLGKEINGVAFIQFSDDGESSHVLAGTFTIAGPTSSGTQSLDFPITGTRSGDKLLITLQAILGIVVTATGEFDFLQHTLTIHTADSSTGCMENTVYTAASRSEYNAALDALRVSTPAATPTPSQGGTCS